jgi:hypothetical protein
VTLISADIAPIITSLASLVAACGSSLAVIMGVWNSWKIKEIHAATNGMKAELVRVTGDAKFAEGVKEGHAEGVLEGRTQT